MLSSSQVVRKPAEPEDLSELKLQRKFSEQEKWQFSTFGIAEVKKSERWVLGANRGNKRT